jgi:uncharacterized protein YdhG (YjbR/CyaY superfamily)
VAESKYTAAGATVPEYIQSLPATHRPLFDRLQALVLGMYPDASADISYGIPTYRMGKKRVYLGAWKDGISLHAIDPAPFKALHPKIKTGRGSLNFRNMDEVPEADVRKVIRKAMEGS